ncbi:MAG: hypothetical protein FWG31_09560 [Oscillospiraceae bacterium]|nr:hypothetical protein [Oscillospiraceae bacterium]
MENKHKEIGHEITFQFLLTSNKFFTVMKKDHPKILLLPKLREHHDWKAREKAFRDLFNHYHDKAREEFIGPLLCSHKLASLGALASLTATPMEEVRFGEYREDCFVNETIAILFAHDIMLNARVKDLCGNNSSLKEKAEKLLAQNPFPRVIYDELTPLHRFRLLLANLNLSEDHLIQNVRQLAYICYQLDAYHRGIYRLLMKVPDLLSTFLGAP